MTHIDDMEDPAYAGSENRCKECYGNGVCQHCAGIGGTTEGECEWCEGTGECELCGGYGDSQPTERDVDFDIKNDAEGQCR